MIDVGDRFGGAPRGSPHHVAGGVLADLVQVSKRTLSLALHLAAGIVLAVVGLELMPEALTGTAAWVPLLAFVVGGALFRRLDHVMATSRDASAAATSRPAHWPSSPALPSTC